MSAGREEGLTARMESLAALAAGIAHEVDNTLAAVLLAVEVLSDSCPGAGDQKILSSLAESARQSMDVLRQMMWLARGVEGEMILFQPRHLIADVGRMARATFPRSIMVVTDYPPDLWLLEGDPLRFYRLLLELSRAGRDALAQEGGRLTLGARNANLDGDRPDGMAPGPYVLVEVATSPAAEVAVPPALSALAEAQGGTLAVGTAEEPGCRVYLPTKPSRTA